MQMTKKYSLLILVTACLLVATVQAQESAMEQGTHSRLSIVQGDVVLQPAISGNSIEATINTPLMAGDRLATGADGAIEVKLSGGATAWLWYESKLELLNSSAGISDTVQTDLKLWYGAVAVSTKGCATGSLVTFDMMPEPLVISAGTVMRLTTESDLSAVYLTVQEGEIAIQSGGSSAYIRAGKTVMLKMGLTDWISIPDPGTDIFDNWYQERERLISGAYHYSADMDGAEIPSEYREEASSLHGYGRWVTIQGTMYWAPYVASGWVPYHNGHWSFYTGWGWTWIPYEPWGWTAFHYGSWSYFFDWGWVWYPCWRWRPHYAHWRYDGRSVHWVAAHPDDPTDAGGVLLQEAVPINSQLQIGIPVEAGQMVDEMLQSKPIRRNAIYSTPENRAGWSSRIPDTLRPSNTRLSEPNVIIRESHSRLEPYRQPNRQTSHPRQIDRPLTIRPDSTIHTMPQQRPPNRINEINRAQPTLQRPPVQQVPKNVKPPKVKQPKVKAPKVKPPKLDPSKLKKPKVNASVSRSLFDLFSGHGNRGKDIRSALSGSGRAPAVVEGLTAN